MGTDRLATKDRNIKALLVHLLAVNHAFTSRFECESLFVRTRSGIFPCSSSPAKTRASLPGPLPSLSLRMSLDPTLDAKQQNTRTVLKTKASDLIHTLARKCYRSTLVRMSSQSPLIHQALLRQALLDIGICNGRFIRLLIVKSKTWISTQDFYATIDKLLSSLNKVTKNNSMLMQLLCFLYFLLEEEGEVDLTTMKELVIEFGGALPKLFEIQIDIKPMLSFKEYYRLTLKACF